MRQAEFVSVGWCATRRTALPAIRRVAQIEAEEVVARHQHISDAITVEVYQPGIAAGKACGRRLRPEDWTVKASSRQVGIVATQGTVKHDEISSTISIHVGKSNAQLIQVDRGRHLGQRGRNAPAASPKVGPDTYGSAIDLQDI